MDITDCEIKGLSKGFFDVVYLMTELRKVFIHKYKI